MIKPLLFDSTHLIIILVIDAQHNTNFPFDFIISYILTFRNGTLWYKLNSCYSIIYKTRKSQLKF